MSLATSRRAVDRRRGGFGLAWGNATKGGLGGGYMSKFTPFPEQMVVTRIAQMDSASGRGIALLLDGSVWTWGNNTNGNGGHGFEMLPSDNIPALLTPRRVTGGTPLYPGLSWEYQGVQHTRPEGPASPAIGPVAAVGQNAGSTGLLLKDGRAMMWGANTYGQLGNGFYGEDYYAAPRPHEDEENGHYLPQWSPNFVLSAPGVPLTGVKQLAMGVRCNYFLMANGDVLYTGQPKGQAQHLYAAPDDRFVKYRDEGGLGGAKVIALAPSSEFIILLLDDGTIRTMGTNGYGQRGEGKPGKTKGEAQEASGVGHPALTGIVAIAIGEYHGAALDSEGHVWTWGRNGNGQLGRGFVTKWPEASEQVRNELSTPMRVPGLSGVVAITAAGEATGPALTTLGSWYCAALLSDGSLRLWGGNEEGQMGDGTLVDKPFPVEPLSAPKHIIGIRAGSGHMTAIQSTAPKPEPCISVTQEGSSLRVKWRPVTGPACLRPALKWNVSINRIEPNPATGKLEKGVGVNVPAGATEALLPIPPAEWANATNRFNVVVKEQAPTEILKGSAIVVTHVDDLHMRVDFTPVGATPPEPGWIVNWHRLDKVKTQKGTTLGEEPNHIRGIPASARSVVVDTPPWTAFTPNPTEPPELTGNANVDVKIEGEYEGSFQSRTIEVEVV